MDARKFFTGLLVVSAAAGVGAVGWHVYRQRRGLGRVINEDGKMPPLVNRIVVDGRVVEHYRANSIPINDRVRLIQGRVYKSIHDPRVHELAAKITSTCRSRDNMCETQAIYDAVRKHVRYAGDIAPIMLPSGEVEPIDTFQSAWRTWTMGKGDCDDHAALIASLLTVMGITARLRVTAPSKWSDWGHIYVVAGLPAVNPKKWIAVDTTLETPTKMGSEARFARNNDYAKPYVKDLPA